MEETGPQRFSLIPRGVHYGWVVVIASFFIQSLSASVMMAFGIFLIPISESLGWSRGQISLAYSLQYVGSGAIALAIGWLTNRFGARKVLLAGSLASIFSLLLAGGTKHLWQLYLYFGLLLGASRSVFQTPIYTTVGLWFSKRLGLAVGLISLGVSLGPLLFLPFFRQLITQVGWANALVVMGVVTGLLLMASSALIRGRPEDMGLKAYGETPGPAPSGKELGFRPGTFYNGDNRGFFQRARKTRPFWLMPVTDFLGCVNHSVILAHGAAMAQDKGMVPLAAAGVLGLVSGFSSITRLGIPILAERVGGNKALALGLGLQAATTLMLLVTHEAWTFYLFAFLFGLGYGGEWSAYPVLMRQYYGSAPVAQLFGVLQLGAALGMGAGGYLGGFLFDFTGNYTAAIWASALAGFLGVMFTLKLPSPIARRAEAPPVYLRDAEER